MHTPPVAGKQTETAFDETADLPRESSRAADGLADCRVHCRRRACGNQRKIMPLGNDLVASTGHCVGIAAFRRARA
jgi:hypothetical protein